MLKIKDNVDLKEKLELFVKDLELTLEYTEDEDSSRFDKHWGEFIKITLENMKKLELIEEVNKEADLVEKVDG